MLSRVATSLLLASAVVFVGVPALAQSTGTGGLGTGETGTGTFNSPVGSTSGRDTGTTGTTTYRGGDRNGTDWGWLGLLGLGGLAGLMRRPEYREETIRSRDRGVV